MYYTHPKDIFGYPFSLDTNEEAAASETSLECTREESATGM